MSRCANTDEGSIHNTNALLYNAYIIYSQSSPCWSSPELSGYSSEFISSSIDLGTTCTRTEEWDHSRIPDQCNSLGEWGVL